VTVTIKNGHVSIFERTNTMAANRSKRIQLNQVTDCFENKHGRQQSWRRPPLAGYCHNRDEVSFLTERTKLEGRIAFAFRCFLSFLFWYWRVLSQRTADLIQALPVAGRKQAVIAHFVKATGQDMLEKAAHKLGGIQCHGLPPMFAGIFITKRDLAVFCIENPAVGDRGLVDVPGKISQRFIGSVATRFTVNDPAFFP